jgi:flagellar hook-associated protein 3 FlgL
MMQPIGDLARSLVARRDLAAALSAQQDNARAMTTGRVADPARHLSGSLSLLSALEADLARGTAYTTSLSQMQTMASGMQAALGVVDDLAQAASGRLLSPATDRDGVATATLAADARGSFDGAVAALQTRIGGMSAFGGTGSDGPALADAASRLAAASGAAAGQVTVTGIVQAIVDWFDDPAGFGATGYVGGPPRPPQPIGPGKSAALPVTADDPALRRTLAGLAIAALSQTLAVGRPTDTAAGLQRAAGNVLLGGKDDRTALAARIGTVEERLATDATRLDAALGEVEMARSRLIGADPAEAATALEARQTQIETIYALTARLSRLTLTDVLR